MQLPQPEVYNYNLLPLTNMGMNKSKPKQPFSEFLEAHEKVQKALMEQNSVSQHKYTEFLIQQIALFFHSSHQHFKDGMCNYVAKNSKPIYQCYRQFLKDNCMTENSNASQVNPSSLEEQFYKYFVEFYQCSLQFSITRKDYLSIIDDVHAFMNFLASLKRSIVKPKLWDKQNKEHEIQPVSNSVEDLLYKIGKKVYQKEIGEIKGWLQNPATKDLTLPQDEIDANRPAFKYLKAILNWADSYTKKQNCLVKLFQNLRTNDNEQQILTYGLSRLRSQEIFIQLLILSRLGSHRAQKLVGIFQKQVPLELRINQ